MSRIRLWPALIFVTLSIVLSCACITPAGAQAVIPDGFAFVDGATVLPAGSGNYSIVLQLTFHGANYSGNLFGISLSSSDQSLLGMPANAVAAADSSGLAVYNVTVGQGYGNVTVYASLVSPYSSTVSVSKTYRVVGFSTVSGTIVDTDGKAVPHATVTLYNPDNGTKGTTLQVQGNPATTDGQGAYTISNVPYGSYIIEAVIDGMASNTSLAVSSPTTGGGLAIEGYYAPTPTPTPTAAPTVEPSPTVMPSPASLTPAPKASTGDSTRQAAWIGAIAIVLAVIIIAAGLWLKKEKK